MSNPTPDTATQQEVRQLLKRLARLKHKWPSEPALRNLNPQMVEALLKHMQAKIETDMNVRFCMLLMFVVFVFGDNRHVPHIAAFTGSAYFLLGLPTQILLDRKHRFTVYALTQTDDMRVLPLLIKATSEGWGRHLEVFSAIKRLLPQVAEQQAGLLDRKAQERLWQLAIAPINFKVECDETLAYGALHTFVHIGDRDTLNRMRQFVLHMTFYPANRRINDALQASIPLMEARLQRQEVPATLLRPSDTPTASPDILLRPAHTITAEPADQLLRAANSETNQNKP